MLPLSVPSLASPSTTPTSPGQTALYVPGAAAAPPATVDSAGTGDSAVLLFAVLLAPIATLSPAATTPPSGEPVGGPVLAAAPVLPVSGLDGMPPELIGPPTGDPTAAEADAELLALLAGLAAPVQPAVQDVDPTPIVPAWFTAEVQPAPGWGLPVTEKTTSLPTAVPVAAAAQLPAPVAAATPIAQPLPTPAVVTQLLPLTAAVAEAEASAPLTATTSVIAAHPATAALPTVTGAPLESAAPTALSAPVAGAAAPSTPAAPGAAPPAAPINAPISTQVSVQEAGSSAATSPSATLAGATTIPLPTVRRVAPSETAPVGPPLGGSPEVEDAPPPPSSGRPATPVAAPTRTPAEPQLQAESMPAATPPVVVAAEGAAPRPEPLAASVAKPVQPTAPDAAETAVSVPATVKRAARATPAPPATPAAEIQPRQMAPEIQAAPRIEAPTALVRAAPAAPTQPDPNPMERAVAQQVSRAIIQHLPDGGARMVMRLTPPELGTVRVEFILRDGAMTARLMADDEGVRRALDRALPQIRAEVRGDHPTIDVTIDRSEQRHAWHEGHARQERRDDPRGGQRRRTDEVFSLDGVEDGPAAAAATPRPSPVLGNRPDAGLINALA